MVTGDMLRREDAAADELQALHRIDITSAHFFNKLDECDVLLSGTEISEMVDGWKAELESKLDTERHIVGKRLEAARQAIHDAEQRELRADYHAGLL